MDSRTTKEKVFIGVVGFNRPEYFERVLKGLRKNSEVERMPVYFFLDGGPAAKQNDYKQLIEKAKFPQPIIETRKENLGCGKNIIGARETLFYYGADKIILFEDDMIPGENYIEVVLKMLDQWPRALCQAWNPFIGSAEEKLSLIGGIQKSEFNFWGYGITKKTWEKMAPILRDYQRRFLDPIHHYSARNNLEIRKWFRGLSSTPYFNRRDTPTGQDAVTQLACELIGTERLTTMVNYGLYIGETGIHATKGIFEGKGFHKVKLDPLPTPEKLWRK